jgi:hypothetical protein
MLHAVDTSSDLICECKQKGAQKSVAVNIQLDAGFFITLKKFPTQRCETCASSTHVRYSQRAREREKRKGEGCEKLFCGFISVAVHFSAFLSPFTFALLLL